MWMFIEVYHLDYILRHILLLITSYCFSLWSADKLQAALSLCAYPVGNVITKYRQAEEKNEAEKVQLREIIS